MGNDGFNDLSGFDDLDLSGGFSDSDGFGDMDDFTSGMSDGFNNSSDGFNDMSGFDDSGMVDDFTSGMSSATAEFDMQDNNSMNNSGMNTNSNGSAFNDEFNDDLNNESALSSKNGIKFIIIGLVLMLIFIFVGSKIRSSNSSSRQVDISNKEKQQASQNVDNVVGNSGKNSFKVKDNNSMQWSEISDSEKIKFNKELTDMTFTITDIKHYARVIDATNSLEVKTTLTGTIGGLPGTYVIDIPYDKGTGLVEGSHKLVEGDYFTVHVQIGTYNDRKVVGEISY